MSWKPGYEPQSLSDNLLGALGRCQYVIPRYVPAVGCLGLGRKMKTNLFVSYALERIRDQIRVLCNWIVQSKADWRRTVSFNTQFDVVQIFVLNSFLYLQCIVADNPSSSVPEEHYGDGDVVTLGPDVPTLVYDCSRAWWFGIKINWVTDGHTDSSV